MQHTTLQDLQRDIAKAYETGDFVAAIESLTEAFKQRRGEAVGHANPIERMRDSVSLDEIIEEQGSRVVTDWRRLSVNIAPEGETAEEFLKPIYADRDAGQDRDPL
ncbi:hypothetical protein [Planctomycetes bacterium TBK1r]|uniref:Uncharacterized protein n=1 Tax=Stieleria magnilauensis TaxID=2527963 RepID=A0ABX5XHD0_9BACT|nr:hypothetical protein TBK1r_01660 [Planctomycetes bacterium TBK1r]